MAEQPSAGRLNVGRLILIPAFISLAVTLLRLTGELLHWSERWFATGTLGPVPSGMSWVIGITWLPIPFGIYFAYRLIRDGRGLASARKAMAFSLLGIVVALAGFFTASRIAVPFPHILIFIWGGMALGALLQLFGWPDLFKTLLAYGLVSRAIVVVVMFLAMRGNWGTHYDYVGIDAAARMPFWSRFFWLGFFPQLIFWVGYTVVLGSLAGSLTAALRRRRERGREVRNAA